MTSPLRQKIKDAIKDNIRVDATGLAPVVVGHYIFGFDGAAEAVLSLFPEGRGEQEPGAKGWSGPSLLENGEPHPGHAGLVQAYRKRFSGASIKAAIDAVDGGWHPGIGSVGEMLAEIANLEVDLSAVRLRVKALVEIADGERLRWMKAAAKHTRADGRRSDHEQADLERARTAERIVDKMRALLSSAQGGTNPVDCGTAYADPGFPIVGLPESPSGERDDPAVGATAALAPFWVSWWDDPAVSFELHSPWWFSGCRFHGVEEDDEDLSQSSVCAAIMANDEDHARRLIGEAYDLPVTLEFRFVEPRPVGWSPFSDRFRAADWMRWPLADGATASPAPDAAALVE